MGSHFKIILRGRDGVLSSEIVAFATETTRDHSLGELGFDITDNSCEASPRGSDNLHSFSASASALCWGLNSASPEKLNTDRIITAIALRFPDTEFLREVYWEGPLSYKEFIKGEFREELVNPILDVGVKDSYSFVRLAERLKGPKLGELFKGPKFAEVFKDTKNTLVMASMQGSGTVRLRQSPPFFIFPLGEMLESEQAAAIERVLGAICDMLPRERFYCILVDKDGEGGLGFWEKGIACDGSIEWEEVSDEEHKAIEISCEEEVWRYNNPDERVLSCLFR